jgi:hypothetical protein
MTASFANTVGSSLDEGATETTIFFVAVVQKEASFLFLYRIFCTGMGLL